MQTTVLHRLEEHLLRGATECASVLGVSYSNYAAMKGSKRPMPLYITYAVDALVALPAEALHELVRKRLAKRKKAR